MHTDWIPSNVGQWLIALWFKLSLTFCFAFSIWLSSGWFGSVGSLLLSRSGSLPDSVWNMLLNAFLKPLGCATYILTTTVAHALAQPG